MTGFRQESVGHDKDLVKLEENQAMQANGKYKIVPKFCGMVAKCGERQDNPYRKGGCLDNHGNGGLED